MQKKRRLLDEYWFPGFRPKAAIKGIFGEPDARVIKLDRQKKHGLRFMRYSALESLRQEGAKESLKWQKLKPYERFAEMIKRHWDGIAAYSRPENKVSLGFVEGFHNKIRVIQRRAYGFRDEEYLRLKILTCMLKEI